MRKVKWATDYLPTANCLVKEPSKQAGNWKKLMGTDTLHIEIGCGKGNYSLDMAKMYKDTGFIAIEKNESAAGIAAKKYDEDTEDKHLEECGFEDVGGEFTYIPNDMKDVTPEQRETIDKMIERLEEFDDVQTVYTNMKPEEGGE